MGFIGNRLRCVGSSEDGAGIGRGVECGGGTKSRDYQFPIALTNVSVNSTVFLFNHTLNNNKISLFKFYIGT